MGTLQKDVTDIHVNSIRVFVSLLDAFQKFKVLICVEDLLSYSYRNMKHVLLQWLIEETQMLLQTQENFTARVMKNANEVHKGQNMHYVRL